MRAAPRPSGKPTRIPDHRAVALTLLNVLLGLGTALSPLLIAVFTEVG